VNWGWAGAAVCLPGEAAAPIRLAVCSHSLSSGPHRTARYFASLRSALASNRIAPAVFIAWRAGRKSSAIMVSIIAGSILCHRAEALPGAGPAAPNGRETSGGSFAASVRASGTQALLLGLKPIIAHPETFS